jgi:hypothetical protein
MKNLHGITREIAIDEMPNKKELLEKAGREWGLEDVATIELYKMNENGETYVMMKKYYNLYNAAMVEGFFGFDF